MALITVVSGSPATSSRTLLLARYVADKLRRDDVDVQIINVRELDPAALVAARADAPDIAAAARLVEQADGVVIATPVYKAAYAGVLKTFLDLLPQFALAGKAVLPLATGGTLAHVLAIDYALRPVLASMGARHVLNGLFLLDKQLERVEPDQLVVEPAAKDKLEPLLADLVTAVRQGIGSRAQQG